MVEFLPLLKLVLSPQYIARNGVQINICRWLSHSDGNEYPVSVNYFFDKALADIVLLAGVDKDRFVIIESI